MFGPNMMGSASVLLPVENIARRSRRLQNQRIVKLQKHSNQKRWDSTVTDCVDKDSSMERLTNYTEFSMHGNRVSQDVFMGCLGMRRTTSVNLTKSLNSTSDLSITKENHVALANKLETDHQCVRRITVRKIGPNSYRISVRTEVASASALDFLPSNLIQPCKNLQCLDDQIREIKSLQELQPASIDVESDRASTITPQKRTPYPETMLEECYMVYPHDLVDDDEANNAEGNIHKEHERRLLAIN